MTSGFYPAADSGFRVSSGICDVGAMIPLCAGSPVPAAGRRVPTPNSPPSNR